MIEISINGEAKEVSHSNLAELLHSLEFEIGKVAVAVNQEFVAKTSYQHIELAAGDSIDIVAPIWGG